MSSQGLTISEDYPAIIEVTKTVELSDVHRKALVVLFSDSVPSKTRTWKELGPNSRCEILEDRIRFHATQFGFFTAVVRYHLPSTSAKLLPSAVSNHPLELTIPEIPEFKVLIPSTRVKTETTVKATLHYDDPLLCLEGSDHCLATACVTLEPHNLTFTDTFPVSLKISDYTKITDRYPNAKLQFLYSSAYATGGALKWEVMSSDEFTINRDKNHAYIATIQSTKFGSLKGIWRGIPDMAVNLGPKHEYHKSITESEVKSISARCQVFMSPVSTIDSGRLISFIVTALVYPFQTSKAYEYLSNYECSLFDSGPMPYVFKGGDLHFTLEIKRNILPNSPITYPASASLPENFCSRAEFEIELDSSAKLGGGTVLGCLMINHGDIRQHKFSLILVNCRSLFRSCNLTYLHFSQKPWTSRKNASVRNQS